MFLLWMVIENSHQFLGVIFPSHILHLWKPKLGTVMWAKKVNFSYILFFKDLDYTTPLFDANTSNTSKVKSHHHPEIFFVTCFFFHAGTWHMLSFFTDLIWLLISLFPTYFTYVFFIFLGVHLYSKFHSFFRMNYNKNNTRLIGDLSQDFSSQISCEISRDISRYF